MCDLGIFGDIDMRANGVDTGRQKPGWIQKTCSTSSLVLYLIRLREADNIGDRCSLPL